MAGHKISGYLSKLWQVVFASFIQLFYRIFPVTKRPATATATETETETATARTTAAAAAAAVAAADTPPQRHQQQQQRSQQRKSPLPPPLLLRATAENHSTTSPSSTSYTKQHNHNHNHDYSHNPTSTHHHPHAQIPEEPVSDCTLPQHHTNCFSDLERGLGAESSQSETHQPLSADLESDDMPHSKRRGGRNRAGGKTNNAQGPAATSAATTTTTTTTPTTTTTAAAAATTPTTTSFPTTTQNPSAAAQHGNKSTTLNPTQPAPPPPYTTTPVSAIPAGVTPLSSSGNTKPNLQQPDGEKRPGSRRSRRNRSRFSPTKQFTDDKKENLPFSSSSSTTTTFPSASTPAPSTNSYLNGNHLARSRPQSPDLKPLAVTEHKAEPQKPGTRSEDVTKTTPTPVLTQQQQQQQQQRQATHRFPSSIGNNDVGKKQSEGDQQQRLKQISTDAAAAAAIDRLTLEDTLQPSAGETLAKSLTKAENAAEASSLPVPVVVALPLATKPFPPKLTVPDSRPHPNLPGLIEPQTDEERAEREFHLKYMREALDMGVLALKTNETPVGAVIVYHGRVIAKGMNATNITRNGTRHAEFMALSALLSRKEKGDVVDVNIDPNPALDDACWGDVDPTDGHIYPYGQKLHPAPVVDRDIIRECVLYVTVEPCVMCASLLRQLGISKVYFGAVNDKFGGTGGVFRIHMNSKPVPRPNHRPYQNGYGPHDIDRISKGRANALPRDEDDGDGGNVERGFPAEGGYLRDDAVSLLRRFYVQENGRAPQPRKKEGRAARLFAMENQVKSGSDLSDCATIPDTPDTPVDPEVPLEAREKLDKEMIR
ncbi:hypothetical protein F4778DRAFT_769967 [Xylariomycetidae sp. FL2044]|nr:hypothetical protein F4778DRAFT_769967 [Xylariomycetidae sp. FL2044]